MSTSNEDVTRVVDALLEVTAPLTQILDHMARAPDPPPTERAVETLRRLLCDTLQPLATAAPAHELRATARLVDAATDLIVDGLYLIPHPPAAPGRRGSRCGSGRRRR